jgi:hypothetical protein
MKNTLKNNYNYAFKYPLKREHYTILQSRKIEGGSECICAKYG